MATKKKSDLRFILTAVGVIGVSALSGMAGAMLAPRSGTGTGTVSPAGAWIQGVQQRSELKVACADSPPTSIVSGDNTCDGPVLLPFKELAQTLNVKFVTIGTTYQSIVAGLQAGQYDIAANIDATMARSLAVRFTVPGWSYPAVFVIERENASRYTDARSIFETDLPVATAQGTSYDQAIAAQKPRQQPTLLRNYQEASQAVQAGRASSLFTDIGTAATYTAADPSLCIIVPDPPLITQSVVNGVSPNIDEHSLQTVNFAIQDSLSQGRFQAAMDDAGYEGDQNLGTRAC